MQVQPSCFDAWQAIKGNRCTLEYLRDRIAHRRERFQRLCDGGSQEDGTGDVPMVPVPEASVLDEEGTSKLLTVLEVGLFFLIIFHLLLITNQIMIIDC